MIPLWFNPKAKAVAKALIRQKFFYCGSLGVEQFYDDNIEVVGQWEMGGKDYKLGIDVAHEGYLFSFDVVQYAKCNSEKHGIPRESVYTYEEMFNSVYNKTKKLILQTENLVDTWGSSSTNPSNKFRLQHETPKVQRRIIHTLKSKKYEYLGQITEQCYPQNGVLQNIEGIQIVTSQTKEELHLVCGEHWLKVNWQNITKPKDTFLAETLESIKRVCEDYRKFPSHGHPPTNLRKLSSKNRNKQGTN